MSGAADGAFEAIVARLGRSVVQVHVDGPGRPAAGAGLVWGDGSVVVTNAHVATANSVRVTSAEGRSVTGRLIRRDPHRDLAIIAAADLDVPAAQAADPRSARPGALVVAIGHPFGVAHAVSVGVLQGVGRAPHSAGLPADKAALDWVQADVRLGPGNSGGPLGDAEGRVLALSTMIANGVALGVPAPEVEALASGAARPRLGLVCEATAGNDAPGLLVHEVRTGGPAERAGVLPGDVLVAAEGVPLRSAADLGRALRKASEAEWLTLDLLRASRWQRCQISLVTSARAA